MLGARRDLRIGCVDGERRDFWAGPGGRGDTRCGSTHTLRIHVNQRLLGPRAGSYSTDWQVRRSCSSSTAASLLPSWVQALGVRGEPRGGSRQGVVWSGLCCGRAAGPGATRLSSPGLASPSVRWTRVQPPRGGLPGGFHESQVCQALRAAPRTQ